MFSLRCGICGTENPDKNQFCSSCGKPLQKPQAQVNNTTAGAGQVPVPAAPKGSGLLPILLIGGIVFLVAVAAVGFFVILPLLADESPSGGDSGSPSADFMNSDDQVNGNAAESSDSLLSGSGGKTGAPATTRAVSSGPQAQSAAGSVVHGTISTGAPVLAAQGSVPASGGTIAVTKPGSPIDGLKFAALPGAYPSGQQVAISSAPVTGNTFGDNFNPVSPLISIDAGKSYADEPILVTIPVTVPDDQFAMAFYYDDASKKLEGVPTASQDSKSITIATRHFSNIIVSMISLSSLDGIKKVDSGFKPGVDTWEFSNPGSYIAPGGYCSGDSVTMMWYYTEQRQKNNAPPLNGRYDNNGREKTPLFPMDNTLGVRFASVVQTESQYKKYWTNPFSMISNVSDSDTFREFKYSMLLTGEPQYVRLESSEGNHAIVCFEVYDNTLWVADPNYPGVERMISFKENKLGPYSSGANSEDIKAKGETVYYPIKYIAKSAIFSWPTLAAEYAKVQDGTIGNDEFPSYEIVIYMVNADSSLKEVSTIQAGKNSELKQVNVDTKTIHFSGLGHGGVAYYMDGTPINGEDIVLNEGSNIIGMEGSEMVNGEDTWTGFDWIDFNYKPKTIVTTAAPAAPPAGQHYTATIYAVTDSSSFDADCGFADKAYENSGTDPYCETVPSYSPIAVMCGKPPGKCIDTKWNNGVHGVFMYYNTLGTKPDGSTYVTNRLKDGDMFYYGTDGTVVSQVTYKDDKQIKTVK